MSGLIKQWSFSTWKQYTTCPAKVKFSKVRGLREPASPAMTRGNEIHKLAEDFLEGEPKLPLPSELKLLAREYRTLKKEPGLSVELPLAFTSSWSLTDWDSSSAWLRVRVDAMYHDVRYQELVIIDHKTGKQYPDHHDQLSLYALAGMTAHDDAKQVRGEMWYIDQGAITRESFSRAELRELREHWERRAKPLLSDRKFAPNPGPHCRWCHYRQGNGGPCDF